MAGPLHPDLPRAPELTATEVRNLGRRASVDTEKEKDKSYDLIRKAHALLKRVDEILARR